MSLVGRWNDVRRKDLKWFLQIHHVCIVFLYVIFLLCIFLNVYVLLSRQDTALQMRIYFAVASILMLACSAVMIEFIVRTRWLPKLTHPHEIPLPALIGAIALTLGISLGYLYFIVFNYAFQDCDRLVDIIFDHELWMEAVYDLIMAGFSVLSLVYIMQRRYFGAINSNLDKVGRLFINITFTVVWIKVVIYKGYTSHQTLCQRKELEGYWCPALKRLYDCDPSHDLHGMSKMWYYINKGLLSSAIISCASEFFPVLLVSHWLACGGADERAEAIHRHQKKKQGLAGLMREFIKDVSRVYVTEEKLDLPPYQPSKWIRNFIWIVVPITMLVSVARWLCFMYYLIDFDDLVHDHWQASDILSLANAALQTLFFIVLYYFSKTLDNERLDAHHKAHARGDIGLLFGCCIVLFVKFILQSVELVYQDIDGFLVEGDVIIRILALALTHVSQWIEYLALRRLLAMSTRDLFACKRFLPLAAMGGLVFSWIHFGCTFIDTTLIKYQLTDEDFRFSEVTLISMIFTQTIFPAEYLYAFTASGCFLELMHMYHKLGFYQIGPPRLHGKANAYYLALNDENKRFAAGENIANLLEVARRMQRKNVRAESYMTTSSDSSYEFPIRAPRDFVRKRAFSGWSGVDYCNDANHLTVPH